MITDTLQHLSRYRGMHPALDTAIDWLETHDLTALPDGRTVIDGETVFINVMEADLHPTEGSDFEYHNRYADLQIDLTGSEYWEWTTSGTETIPFDTAKDIGFLSGTPQAGGVLGEKRFVLFFPQELHKPSCLHKHCTHVRKAVVKIQMNQN